MTSGIATVSRPNSARIARIRMGFLLLVLRDKKRSPADTVAAAALFPADAKSILSPAKKAAQGL